MRERYIILFYIVLLLPFQLWGESWEGTGQESDPYRIATVEHLQELADSVNNGTSYEGYYFVLEENLNMADSLVDCTDWIPIGVLAAPFAASFDGNGHSIDSIVFKGENNVGLFGCTSHTAVIQNLEINQPSGWSNVGMGVICGLNEGLIQNCHVNTGCITCAKVLGGIAGINYGVIDSCSNNCYLYSNLATGGIAGFNYGEIKNCVNSRGFDGLLGTGGIVGYNGGFKHIPCNHAYHERGFVSHCTNEGRVFGDTYTGGICGRNDGSVLNCENTALIKSLTTVGGIVGVNGSVVNAKGFVYNSFNTGTVYAEDSTAGAICAINTAGGTIENVFNAGSVLAGDTLSSLLVAYDNGWSQYLYDLQVDREDSTYYEVMDSIATQLSHWADTTDKQYIYPWLWSDSTLQFGEYIPSAPTGEEDQRMDETSYLSLSAEGVWLEAGSSIYTVKGELIYLNQRKEPIFIHLQTGLYIVGRKKVLIVNQ